VKGEIAVLGHKPVGIWRHDVNEFLAADDRELNLPGIDFLFLDAAGAIRATFECRRPFKALLSTPGTAPMMRSGR